MSRVKPRVPPGNRGVEPDRHEEREKKITEERRREEEKRGEERSRSVLYVNLSRAPRVK